MAAVRDEPAITDLDKALLNDVDQVLGLCTLFDMTQELDDNLALLGKRIRDVYGSAKGPTHPSELGAEIPEDYAKFLSLIGGGTVGHMFFEVYDKPLRPREIYGPEIPAHLDDVLVIGDDYNGYCVALDPSKQWAVVEIDKHSLNLEVLASTLLEFLMNDRRMDPSGENT